MFLFIALVAQPKLDRYGDPLPPGAVARFGTARQRHANTVFAVGCSANQAASASFDGTIRLWDRQGNEQLRVRTNAFLMAFSSDGLLLASAGPAPSADEDTLKLWDGRTGAALGKFPGHRDSVHALAFSPDGKTLAVAVEVRGIVLWDPATGRVRSKFAPEASEVKALAFSPDGSLIASAEGSVIRVYRVPSGEKALEFRGHGGGVTGVAFSPDGTTIASSSHDRSVRLWRLSGASDPRVAWTHSAELSSIAISPDSRILASGSWDGTIVLWPMEGEGEPRRLVGHSSWVSSVAFWAGGKTLVSGSADHTVRYWDVSTGASDLEGHGGEAFAAAFAPDGRSVATAGRDNVVRVWDLATSAETRVIRGHEGAVVGVGYFPDGSRLASSSRDGTIRVWEGARQVLKLQEPVRDYHPISISPDGRWVASGAGDGTVRLWDAASGGIVAELRGHCRDVTEVAFSSDGDLVASVSLDTTARIWSPARAAELRILRGVGPVGNAVAFSPDGALLSAGSAGLEHRLARVWEVSSGQETPELASEYGEWAEALVFRPGGNAIVAGDYDGTIRLFDVRTGKEMGRLQPDAGAVRGLALSPDGARVASAMANGTTLVWELPPEAAPKGPQALDLGKLWESLGTKEDEAHEAIWALAQTPGAAGFIQQKLSSAGVASEVPKLIAGLDDDAPAVRAESLARLKKLGIAAEPEVRSNLARQRSAEVRAALESVLDELTSPMISRPEELRRSRAIRTLEKLRAERVLEFVAESSPSSRERLQARSALQRLGMKLLLAKVRVHVFISGVVQSVSFRASTQTEAERLGGIVGWVRNLSDGRVEGVFQGPKDKVGQLVEWCRRGPPAARVSGLDTADESPGNDLKSFEIKPDR